MMCAFFGLLFGVEALPIHDCGDVDTHTHNFFTTTTQTHKHTNTQTHKHTNNTARLTGQMLADIVQRKGVTAGSLDGWGWSCWMLTCHDSQY